MKIRRFLIIICKIKIFDRIEEINYHIYLILTCSDRANGLNK
jgi:hypothetical protein